MICVLNLWKTSLRRCSLRRTTLRRRSVVNLRAWARLRLSPKGRGRKWQTGEKESQVDGRTAMTPDRTSPTCPRGRPRSMSSEENKAPGQEANGRSSHEPNGAEVVVKEEPMEEENHTELAAGPVVLAVATAEEAKGAKDSVGTFLMPPPPPPPTAPDQRTTSRSSAAVLQGEQETAPEGV